MVSIKYPGIRGQLRITVSEASREGGRVYLEGDPDGLRSLAALLLALAATDQSSLPSLPDAGASEHVHLKRDDWLAPQSTGELVVGRLDDKHGRFDKTFEPRVVPAKGDIAHGW